MIAAEIQAEEARVCRWLIKAFWVLAIVLGLVAFWIDRNSTNTDGISYVDVASAFSRHDWTAGINAYWSPLYPFILGLALRLLRPSPFKEFTVVHLVNFVIFLGAAASFNFFMSRLLRRQRQLAQRDGAAAVVFLPEWAMLALGYALFLWTSLRLITISDISPDMLVALFVYVAAGIVLGMRSERVLDFAVLGAILGLGYLAKAPMLPVGIIFLAGAIIFAHDLRKAAIRLPIAIAALIIAAAPFAVALSHIEGRFTWGDSAKLNYAWYVNHVPRYHWQGDMRGLGSPIHPTKKIYEVPAVYEFHGPKPATYSIWFDPSYWNEGVRDVFDWKSILVQIRINLQVYDDVILTQQGYLIVTCALLFLLGTRTESAMSSVAKYGVILLPAIAALTMYVLVHVENRMIAPFDVLLWMGLFAAVRFEGSSEIRRAAEYVVICVVAFTVLIMGLGQLGDIASHGRAELTAWSNDEALPQWQIATSLRRLGVEPGDKVAWIRPSVFDDKIQNYSWARLARVEIVAEISTGGADDFWSASPAEQSKILDAFARTGAVALVVTKIPARFSPGGWLPLGKTGYFLHPLQAPKQ